MLGGLSGFLACALFVKALPLFAYFAMTPLLMAGLSSGVRSAISASAVGSLVVLIAGTVTATYSGVAMYVATQVIPAVVLTYFLMQSRKQDQVRYWYPFDRALSFLTLAGLFIGAIVMVSWIGESDVSMTEMVRSWLKSGVFGVIENGSASAPVAAPMKMEIERMLNTIAPYFVGVMGMSWVFMLAINTFMAQAFLLPSQQFGRSLIRLGDFQLSFFVIIWGVVFAAVALFTEGTLAFVGLNGLFMLASLCLLSGLGVVHVWARRFKARRWVLLGVYVVLAIVSWMAILVAVLGLADHWIRIRDRVDAANQNDN